MIIFISNLLNNPNNKASGIFNHSRINGLKSEGYDLIAICPINLFPVGKYFNNGLRLRQIILNIISDIKLPQKCIIDGTLTYFPKYIAPPKKMSWFLELIFMNIFAGPRIKRIVLQHKPTTIISSFIHPSGTYAKYIKRVIDVKYISYMEGSDILINPDKYGGWDKMLPIINNDIDFTISVSKSMHDIAIRDRGIINNVFIPNGYREDLFSFKKKPDTNGSEMSIISIGGIRPVKGHDLLLRSLKLLNKSYNIRLTIVGGGRDNKLFDKESECLPDNIRLTIIDHIPQDALSLEISNNQFLCLPSRSEGLPSSALEAMACGRPVIAFNVGGLDEIIIDGFNGYLAQPNDVISLSEKIEKAFLTNWAHMEIASWIKHKFSWKTSIKSLIQLIESNKNV